MLLEVIQLNPRQQPPPTRTHPRTHARARARTLSLSHPQVNSIKKIAGYVAQIRRVGTGHGVWDLDRALEGPA
jgi:hypothetical protein